MRFRLLLGCLAFVVCGCSATQPRTDQASAALDRVVASEHRSHANRLRDDYRHPQQTLGFFGIEPDWTVVEVWPGAGWYTEILAPFLRERGRLYAAQIDPAAGDYARGIVAGYRAK